MPDQSTDLSLHRVPWGWQVGDYNVTLLHQKSHGGWVITSDDPDWLAAHGLTELICQTRRDAKRVVMAALSVSLPGTMLLKPRAVTLRRVAAGRWRYADTEWFIQQHRDLRLPSGGSKRYVISYNGAPHGTAMTLRLARANLAFLLDELDSARC